MGLGLLSAALLFLGGSLIRPERSPLPAPGPRGSWREPAGGQGRPEAPGDGEPDAQDCGTAPLADVLKGSRIIGGTEAQTGAWPWMVSLQIQSGRYLTHVCAGSLVKKREPVMWRVVVGTNKVDGTQPTTKKMKVKAIIIHPEFDVDSYVNDIALFHLKKAVKYNDYIQPICLPFGVFQKLNRKTKCFITGWGRTKEEGNITKKLQEAEVHYISRNFCNSEKSYGGIIPNTSFCAGDEDGVFDTCRGDSGGPLMCYLPEHKRYFVMGITSYGYGCGRKNFPGVYSGPVFFQKWLTDHFYQGGAFYFMEHVAAKHSTWNYFWQQVLNPVWYLLFDGCSLTRESWKTLEQAGFSKLKLQHLQAPLSWKLMRPHIYGYAVK
ncbi:transmembrane protease serine 12 isoform X2 [Vicugna pacos]|uniref:Transmembrane protease serine 12 isoform X2 n=1 Tax=Vicugna pacos TaxID=30538 RepID=A0ABM5E6W9_VICPA